jgi:hypothetical protein
MKVLLYDYYYYYYYFLLLKKKKKTDWIAMTMSLPFLLGYVWGGIFCFLIKVMGINSQVYLEAPTLSETRYDLLPTNYTISSNSRKASSLI